MIEEKREALRELCARYGVARLEIFGSAAVNAAVPDESDLDFLVAFNRTGEMNLADQFFGLLEDLKSLFGREVDLVVERSMKNPYFIKAVNDTRKVVYAA